MARTPDRFPGEGLEEGLLFDNRSPGQEPTVAGGVRYVDGAFYFRDSAGLINPRDYVTEGGHEDLDTLVHSLAETSYLEVTRSGGQVTDVIVWTNSGKTIKIRETNISRTGGQVSQIVHKHYDAAGAIITGQTLTGSVTRTGGVVTSIDWVQS